MVKGYVCMERYISMMLQLGFYSQANYLRWSAELTWLLYCFWYLWELSWVSLHDTILCLVSIDSLEKTKDGRKNKVALQDGSLISRLV